MTTYKESGVDIEVGDQFIKKILPIVKSTYKPEVLAGVGGFAAHTALNLDGIDEPVIVSSTDGVGTKLKIAQKLGKYNTIGIDLVAMCVNDISCSGAKPLIFLDYFAVDKLEPECHSEIVRGIAEGCKIAGCALVGGETAEMPGIYQKGDFDLAGFAVGIVDRKKIIDGSNISIGNTIIGIESSGIHSNGYSLVRNVLDDTDIDESHLCPTRIYSKLITNIVRDFEIHGIAHITGGGLIENVPRILPEKTQARIELNSWERPQIFTTIQKKGNVPEKEMQRVFNLGIGMVLIVPAEKSIETCERIRSLGEKAHVIGEITERTKEEPPAVLE